jgi:hypothetical protein
MIGKWTVKLDARVRPIIEAIAHEEQRDPAQVALAQRALAQRPAPMMTDAALAQRRA